MARRYSLASLLLETEVLFGEPACQEVAVGTIGGIIFPVGIDNPDGGRSERSRSLSAPTCLNCLSGVLLIDGETARDAVARPL